MKWAVGIKTRFLIVGALVLLFALSPISGSVYAIGSTPQLPRTGSEAERMTVVQSLDSFTQELINKQVDGLWAENQFAFKIRYGAWGYVPDAMNTASFTSYQNYSGFFIHDYQGGEVLYHVHEWTRVAYIHDGEVSWFMITEAVKYLATNYGKNCYIDAPFYKIEGQSQLGSSISTQTLLDMYYTRPFTIQTCLCSAGINGVQILVGEWTSPPPDSRTSIQ